VTYKLALALPYEREGRVVPQSLEWSGEECGEV
jgi:hypothetical protein